MPIANRRRSCLNSKIQAYKTNGKTAHDRTVNVPFFLVTKPYAAKMNNSAQAMNKYELETATPANDSSANSHPAVRSS